MELTHAVTLAPLASNLELVFACTRANIAIFDNLTEQLWLGLSLVGLLIHQPYSPIDTMSIPVEREWVLHICSWKTVMLRK